MNKRKVSNIKCCFENHENNSLKNDQVKSHNNLSKNIGNCRTKSKEGQDFTTDVPVIWCFSRKI